MSVKRNHCVVLRFGDDKIYHHNLSKSGMKKLVNKILEEESCGNIQIISSPWGFDEKYKPIKLDDSTLSCFDEFHGN